MKMVFGFLFILFPFAQHVRASVSCDSLLGHKIGANTVSREAFDSSSKNLMEPLDFNPVPSITETPLDPAIPSGLEDPRSPVGIRSRSPRIEIYGSSEKPRPKSVLNLTEVPFSENLDEASLELVRAFLVTSDSFVTSKEATRKNKFSLGFRVSQKYSLIVNYVAASLNTNRFLPASVSLLYPNGQEVVIAKDFLSQNSETPVLETSRFILSELLPQGYDINLKIPLAIDGELLHRFNFLVSFFEYFPVETQKASLQKLFSSDSLKYIRTQLKLEYYKQVFFKQIIKEPFKVLLMAIPMFIMPTIYNHYSDDHAKNSQKHQGEATRLRSQGEDLVGDGATQSTSFITERLNGIQIPRSETKVLGLLNDLKVQAAQFSQATGPSSPNGTLGVPSAYDFASIPKTAFSKEHMMWTFEKPDETRPGVTNTFVVFAKERNTGIIGTESGNQVSTAVTYAIMRIDAVKYAPLIAFINRTNKR